MADEREYEAGAPLDPEAEAFVEAHPEKNEPPIRAADEPDFEPPPRKAKPEKPVAELEEEPGEDEEADPEEAAKQAATERRARSMGWVPPEEFRGDKGRKALTAQEFMDRANPAILHERLEKQAELREKDRQDFERTVSNLERVTSQAVERQKKEFQRELSGLAAERDALIEKYAGDAASIKQINKNYEEAVQEAHTSASEAQPKPAETQDGPAPEIVKAAKDAGDAWVAARPQYKTDPDFRDAAFNKLGRLSSEYPNDFKKQFAELDAFLSKRFPEHYERSAPARPGAAPPPADRDMGGVRIAPKRTSNYAAKLNDTERRLGEKFVKQGLFKTVEDYAKDLHTND